MLDLLTPLFQWFRPQQTCPAQVELYTWQLCPYCIRAKWLLTRKGVQFIEYKIDGDTAARNTMAERANGGRSVPQIFINDAHVGGCDDIHALDRDGTLDELLAIAPDAP